MMNWSNIIYYGAVILAVLILGFVSFYFYLKDRIRTEAIKNEVEIDKYDISGEEKMEIVVQCLIEYVPFLLKFAFSPTSLQVLAQETYESLKEFWLQRLEKEGEERK